MQTPPDFLTDTEQRELDKLVELEIDTAIEERHIHEVVVDIDVDDTDSDLRSGAR